jgi:hypothetical protein
MTAQLLYGIERFVPLRCFPDWGQVVPPLVKPVQQVRQRLHGVSPLFWSTAPSDRVTVLDKRRRLGRRSDGDSLAPRPIGG